MSSRLDTDTMKDFWDWIAEHCDDVGVQYIDDTQTFYLYVAFGHDISNAFTERYQYQCEDGGCPCKMSMNGLCFNVSDLEGGCDFTMKDLWEARPAGIENTTGANIY